MLAAEVPACWSWPVTTQTQQSLADAELIENENARRAALDDVLAAWQAGHCAICGDIWRRIVWDHCHNTGYLRGLLCNGCNRREAHSREPLFMRYRLRPPAVMLGIRRPYARPDSARAVLSVLGPDPAEALERHQAERDPVRRL